MIRQAEPAGSMVMRKLISLSSGRAALASARSQSGKINIPFGAAFGIAA
jgi:hypothetical protein